MIITRLRGGLGNQMFQYAMGVRVARENGTKLKIDLSWFSSPGAINPKREYDLDIFSMNPPIASYFDKLKLKIFGKRIYEKLVHMKIIGKNVFLDGFWQRADYLSGLENELRTDFKFKYPIDTDSVDLARKISCSNSVCVNVRRTDFVSDGKFIGTSFYDESAKLINSKVSNSTFFVFSDDIPWCKANLQFLSNVVFVGYDHAGKKFGNYLQLMTLCKHFIIPNSTFAWWAAWLSNEAKKIVIVPKGWPQGASDPISDIIPPEWIQM